MKAKFDLLKGLKPDAKSIADYTEGNHLPPVTWACFTSGKHGRPPPDCPKREFESQKQVEGFLTQCPARILDKYGSIKLSFQNTYGVHEGIIRRGDGILWLQAKINRSNLEGVVARIETATEVEAEVETEVEDDVQADVGLAGTTDEGSAAIKALSEEVLRWAREPVHKNSILGKLRRLGMSADVSRELLTNIIGAGYLQVGKDGRVCVRGKALEEQVLETVRKAKRIRKAAILVQLGKTQGARKRVALAIDQLVQNGLLILSQKKKKGTRGIAATWISPAAALPVAEIPVAAPEPAPMPLPEPAAMPVPAPEPVPVPAPEPEPEQVSPEAIRAEHREWKSRLIGEAIYDVLYGKRHIKSRNVAVFLAAKLAMLASKPARPSMISGTAVGIAGIARDQAEAWAAKNPRVTNATYEHLCAIATEIKEGG